jgi:hypothetical protein
MSTENTLVSITAEMHAVIQQIIENGGELTPELESGFTEVGERLAEKTDAYAYFLDRLETEAEFWRSRADSLLKTAKACESLKKRLSGNIKFVMERLDQKEVCGSEMRFTLAKAKPALVIDEKALDPAYFMQVTEMVPDKERIKSDLELGVPVPGAKLEGGYSLRKYPNSKKDSK